VLLVRHLLSGSRARPPGSRSRESSRLHLVATPGGHLDLLLALRDRFESYERVWVVSPGSTASSLVAEGETVRFLPRFHGWSAASLRLAVRSLRPALRERPDVIVTSGSGSVVPFCLMAQALGAQILFIETMARVENGSDAGKILSRVAHSVLVQWPEMLSVYPQARVCRPVLLDQVPATRSPRSAGEGTFVAVGTHIDPFDRLLASVDTALEAGVLPTPALAQTGVCSYQPVNMRAVQWMLPAEMDKAAAGARYVVSHAGSGIIARSLNAGLTPLVLPRLQRHGEHVDDHQVQITERLGRFGFVVPIDDHITREDVKAADRTAAAPDVMTDLPSMSAVVSAELERIGNAGFRRN